MFRDRTLLPTLVLLASFVYSGAHAQQTVGQGEPLRDELRFPVTEAWSVGSNDLLIGEVREILVDHDGTVYFLDAQLQSIQVIAPDGTWLRSLGREGEGPGEFRAPMDLFFLPDGRLGVLQSQPPKIALLDKEGNALDDHPLAASTTGYRILMTGDAFDGGLALVNMQFRPQDDGNLGTAMVLTTIDTRGELIAELLEHVGGVDYAAMSADEEDLDNFMAYWTMTSDGRIVAITTFDRYRLEVFETDGTLAHTIERPCTPRERTESEKEAVSDRYNMVVNGREVEILPKQNARVLTGVFARPAGHLWVRVDSGPVAEGAERHEIHFDEFDARGSYVGATVVEGSFGSATANVYVRGEWLFVVRGGSESEEEIGDVTLTCYELPSAAIGSRASERASRE